MTSHEFCFKSQFDDVTTKPPSGNLYSLPKSVKRSVGFARMINFHFYLLVVMIDEHKEEDETDEACRQFHQH